MLQRSHTGYGNVFTEGGVKKTNKSDLGNDIDLLPMSIGWPIYGQEGPIDSYDDSDHIPLYRKLTWWEIQKIKFDYFHSFIIFALWDWWDKVIRK